MISKRKLNPCSALLVLLAALSCATPSRGPAEGSGREARARYEVRAGAIYRSSECPAEAVRVGGAVARIHQDGAELYYLRSRAGGEAPSRAGYINSGSGVSYEVDLPEQLRGRSLRRFTGAGGAIFLLACGDGERKGPCTLHRIELNTMREKIVEGVRDITLFRGKPVLLSGSRGGLKVDNNGVVLPITIGGEARFGSVLGDRFLTVTNGEDTELLDLALMRNIYAWPSTGRFAAAEDHNLLLEAVDAGGAPSEKLLFYKVFVNGTNSGRTTTGPAQQAQRCSLKLSDNEYHIIRLERWELHGGQEKYLRANNINQPRPLKVFMPSNRLLKLVVTREGGKYKTVRAAVKEDEK